MLIPLPSEAIKDVLGQLHGTPAFLAGSCVAADVYGKTEYGDVDVFVPTPGVLFATVQRLLDQGACLDDRAARAWFRWQRYGVGKWHTNSIKVQCLNGVEVNIIYKLVDGHPTTKLSQVLESFDFGYLAAGYRTENGRFYDFRGAFFSDLDPDGPLRMMDEKRENWIQGFFSLYNGTREPARLGKAVLRTYDMSLVIPDMVQGYRMSTLYHQDKGDPDSVLRAQLYTTIADRIELAEWQELVDAYKTIDFNDPLDEIMKKLE